RATWEQPACLRTGSTKPSDAPGFSLRQRAIRTGSMSLPKEKLTAIQRHSTLGKTEPLPTGSAAPDFTLYVTPNQTLSLKELLGRPIILAFYPADWSPVCGDQMALYNEILPEFAGHGAVLVGISVDGVWCHAAFSQNRRLHFPLASDFEPKGAVARR